MATARTWFIGVLLLTVLATPAGAAPVEVDPLDNARADLLAVSVLGNAKADCFGVVVCVQGVAATATGGAEGGVAVAGNASNAYLLGVGVVGAARSDFFALSVLNNSTADVVSLSVFGTARCSPSAGCVAVSLLGEGETVSGCSDGALCGESLRRFLEPIAYCVLDVDPGCLLA